MVVVVAFSSVLGGDREAKGESLSAAVEEFSQVVGPSLVNQAGWRGSGECLVSSYVISQTACA